MKSLYLIRGIPGSGKSSLVKTLCNTNAGHIEADMFFVDNETGEYQFDPKRIGDAHQWCQSITEQWMGSYGYSTIFVSNTFTQEWEMEPYYELAHKYGYTVFSLIVENRHGGVNEHGVPEEKLIQMENRLRNSIKLR